MTTAVAERLAEVIDERIEREPLVTTESLHDLKQHKKKAFIVAFRETGIVRDGCQGAGISRSTCEYWRRHDPKFKALFDLAYEDAIDSLERHALKRAKDAKKPSDILTIFLLKGARPHKYRDNVSISGHDGGPLFRVVRGIEPGQICGVEAQAQLPEPKAELEDGKQEV